MKAYILDLETKPDDNLKDHFYAGIKPKKGTIDPVKIAAQIEAKKLEVNKKMSTDPDYCRIVCIGIKEIAQKGALFALEDMPDWFNEKTKEPMVLITFNGKGFDIPVIIKAGLRNKINLPYKHLYDVTRKYHDEGHIDLMEKLSFGQGVAGAKSLDEYLKIYLGIEKETKGDDFFETATDEDLCKHCLEDLELTERLFKRVRRIL